jgi:hypothetical protein
MLDGCGPDNEEVAEEEGNTHKLPFFFLLSTLITAALSMRRILRFSEIGEARRRIQQIDILVDYRFAEAELFVRNQNLAAELTEDGGRSVLKMYNAQHSDEVQMQHSGVQMQKLSSKVGLQTTKIEEAASERESNSAREAGGMEKTRAEEKEGLLEDLKNNKKKSEGVIGKVKSVREAARTRENEKEI